MFPDTQFKDTRPVFVAGGDGTIIAQNKAALIMLSLGMGKYCWDVVGKLEDSEMLPCRHGCVLELLASGMDCSQYTQ